MGWATVFGAAADPPLLSETMQCSCSTLVVVASEIVEFPRIRRNSSRVDGDQGMGGWSVFIGIGAHKITIGDEINEKINDVEKWHPRMNAREPKTTTRTLANQQSSTHARKLHSRFVPVEPLEVDGITRGADAGAAAGKTFTFRHLQFTKLKQRPQQ